MVAMNEPVGRRGKHKRNGARGAGDEDLVARIRGGTAEAVRSVKSQARATARQLEEAAGELTHTVVNTVREGARHAVEQQKGQALVGVARVGEVASQAAHALRAVKADGMAEYVDAASRRVERATEYLEERTVTEMIDDASEVVRRNRTIAVGGMLVAGFAISRFLKASASRAAVAADADGKGKRSRRRRAGKGSSRSNGRARRRD